MISHLVALVTLAACSTKQEEKEVKTIDQQIIEVTADNDGFAYNEGLSLGFTPEQTELLRELIHIPNQDPTRIYTLFDEKTVEKLGGPLLLKIHEARVAYFVESIEECPSFFDDDFPAIDFKTIDSHLVNAALNYAHVEDPSKQLAALTFLKRAVDKAEDFRKDGGFSEYDELVFTDEMIFKLTEFTESSDLQTRKMAFKILTLFENPNQYIINTALNNSDSDSEIKGSISQILSENQIADSSKRKSK